MLQGMVLLNNDEFSRDVHQDGETKDKDFGATANIEQGRSRQVNPNVITIQKDQIIQFRLAENDREHEDDEFLDKPKKYLPRQRTGTIYKA